ncbi:Cut8 six-helix bundle-domain-containing protein [Gilbertella persicaria]|uniref:Cut8 six-helix bundle-domain-containing protein n=1 Tax=Gilbertella persicaria TaxID=101096 RepID=UPI00221E55E5|nr:Cut8 six-helix bundle-domain-containing protein [Gilbertella persicaria]KAI8061487.1 Cut8 six-helix bundle-domain-containing protein [Gilbertella persicaria]
MAHLQQHNKDICRGRKRRTVEDEEMSECTAQKPLLMRKIKSPESKRQRTTLQKRTTRGALLDTLDKEALIHILDSILKSQPQVRKEIIHHIPAPTILSAMNVLVDLEKKFLASFPFNKNGPGRDDYTFSRVRDALTDYIDTITQYANHFTSIHIFPSHCFTFLDHATHMAHRLPNWDSEENNRLKKELYQNLNLFWKSAIQITSQKLHASNYNPDTVREWAKHLAQHNSHTHGCYFTEAVHEFTRTLGYFMDPNTLNSCHHISHTLVPSVEAISYP